MRLIFLASVLMVLVSGCYKRPPTYARDLVEVRLNEDLNRCLAERDSFKSERDVFSGVFRDAYLRAKEAEAKEKSK